MAELSLNLPVVGEKDTTAEPKVTTALTEIQTQFNGKIAAVNLEAGAVTDAKVATNRALVTTNNSYAAAKSVTKAEIEAGIEFSATRMAFVLVLALTSATSTLTIGGVSVVGNIPVTGGRSFMVTPGQKLKGTSAAEPAAEYSALLL